jgi:hypothetical protein
MITYGAGAFIVGSFLNVGIKKVYMKFLAFPIYARIPLRLALFSLPFLAMYSKFNEHG